MNQIWSARFGLVKKLINRLLTCVHSLRIFFRFLFSLIFSSTFFFLLLWREIPEESWFIVISVEILIHVKENCVIVLRWCNAAEEWLCAIRNYPLWCCNKQNINWVMLWIKKILWFLWCCVITSWMIITLNVLRSKKKLKAKRKTFR